MDIPGRQAASIAVMQNGPDDRLVQPMSRLSDLTYHCTPRGEYRGPSESGDIRRSQRTRSYNASRSQYQTSIKKLKLKDIVLTTGHGALNRSDIVKQVVRDGSRITLVPYEHSLISKICMRCVWACIDKESMKDDMYIKFIKKVVEEKLKDAGSDRKVQDFLSPKLMLLDGLSRDDLPKDLKSYNSISFSPESFTAEKIIEFIQGRYDEQVKKVEEAISNSVRGPLLHVIGELKLLTTTNPEYLQRAQIAMTEALEDASSYPRQLLMQLYKMVNVRIINEDAMHRKSGRNQNLQKISIELRPIHIETCTRFLRDCVEGSFGENIRSHIKINGHPFMGQMEFFFHDVDLIVVMEKLLPGVRNYRHELETAINKREWDDIERLLKMSRNNSSSQTAIPKLKHITATYIYEHFLKKLNLTPYTFLKIMRSYSCLDPLEGIRCHKGYNAMHLAILHERDDFLKMLFYSNQWGILYHDIVQPVDTTTMQSSHKGYIPRRLAEALSYKSKGYDILCEFEKLDLIWRSMQPIMKACLSGSLDYVDTLVTLRTDLLHLKDISNSNCLFYACASGNTKLVSYLIAKNVPRNVKNENEESALHIAAMFGHTEILRVLAETQFDIRGQRNKLGNTAIDYCAMNGDLDVLKLYKDMSFQIDSKALTLAAKYRQDKIVEFLIGMTKPNEGEDEDGRLALHYEVINGNARTVQMLLEDGANPSLKDRYKKNVFHLAADYCRSEVLDCLLASLSRDNKVIRDMLDSTDTYLGKDLLYVVRGKDRGRKAWHWVELRRLCVNAFQAALHSGQIDVATYGKILKSGFGPGPDEKTQEMMRIRTEDLLKANGGEGNPDMTPLHVAVLKSCEKVVAKFLEYGANPNKIDHIGATPVHYAAMTGNVKILALLEDCGARLDVKTLEGKTPKMIADENLNVLAANFIDAQPIIDKAKEFVYGYLGKTADDLSSENLQDKRASGKNIKRYLIDTLRELTIDIHQVLFDLGSGPILEESETTPVPNPAPSKYEPSF